MSREVQNESNRNDLNIEEKVDSNQIIQANNSAAVNQNNINNEKYDEEDKSVKKYIKDLNEYHLSFESEKYSNPLKFGDLYEFQFIIGRGAFGQVICATQKSNQQRVAIKIIEKKQLKKFEGLEQEAKILQQFENEYIIKYLNSHESSKFFMIVMEYFDGSSLNEFLRNRKTVLTNDEIRRIIKKVLQAINHMHSLDIIHRDLKPDNILIKETSECFDIKVIDFGLSFKNENVGTVNDNCGTLIYMAPEVAFNRQYQRSVDLWSTGIIQYMLFTMGKHPLWEKKDDKKSFLNKLKNPQWVFPDNMNKEARQFFLKTAATVAEDRMNVAQCLKHVWISGEGNLSVPLTMHDQIQCFQNCQTFCRILKLLVFSQYIKNVSKSKGLCESKTIEIFVQKNHRNVMDESMNQEDAQEVKEKSVSFNSTNLEDSQQHPKSAQKLFSSFMLNNNQNMSMQSKIKRKQTFDDEHYILNVKMSQSKYNFHQKSLVFRDQISENESNSFYKSGSSHNQSQNDFRIISSKKVTDIGIDEEIISPIGVSKGLLTKSNAGDQNASSLFSNQKNSEQGPNQQSIVKKQSMYHIRKYAPKRNQNEFQTSQQIQQQEELQNSINDSNIESPLQQDGKINIFSKQPQNKRIVKQIQKESILKRSNSSKINSNIRRNSKSSVNLQYAKSNAATPQSKKDDNGNASFFNQHYLSQANEIQDPPNNQNIRMNTLNEQQEESMLTERSNPQNTKREEMQKNIHIKVNHQAMKTMGGGDEQAQFIIKQTKNQLNTDFELQNLQASPSHDKLKNTKSITFKNSNYNYQSDQKCNVQTTSSNLTPQKSQKQMPFSPRSSCPINKTQFIENTLQNRNANSIIQQNLDFQSSLNSYKSKDLPINEQNRKKKTVLKSNYQMRDMNTLSLQNSPQLQQHKLSLQQDYLTLEILENNSSENLFKKRRSVQNNYDEQFKNSLHHQEQQIISNKLVNFQSKVHLTPKMHHMNTTQDNSLKLPPINLQNRSISMQQNQSERCDSQGNLSNISVNSFNSDQPIQAQKQQLNSTSSLKIYDKLSMNHNNQQRLKSHFYNDCNNINNNNNNNNVNRNPQKQNSISISTNITNTYTNNINNNNTNNNNNQNLLTNNNQFNSLQINGRSSNSYVINYNSPQKKSIIKIK